MAPHGDGQDKGKKKASKSEESKKKPEDLYVLAGRRIARCVDLWCELEKVVDIVQNIQQDEESKAGELDEDDAARRVRQAYLDKILPEAREHALETYYKILQFLPSLKDVVEDRSQEAALANICSKITSAIRSTHASDTNGLRMSIPRYASPDPKDATSLNPPIILSNGRAEMGLNHPVLARWLCPAEFLEEFDENPEQARKDLASGVMPMMADNFPSFFWSGEMPGDDYDPKNVCHGAFRSYFLVRIARHIFLGPRSGIPGDETKKSRSCNAILNDITTIEPVHIAYVCLQARFAISSMSQWSEKDGTFHYHHNYDYVIHLLKTTPDTVWRDELLKWWNKEIFGDENGRVISGTSIANLTNGDSTSRLSTMAKFHAQAEARLAGAVPAPVLDPSLLASSFLNGIVSTWPNPVASTPVVEDSPASRTHLSASGLGVNVSQPHTPLRSSDAAPILQRTQVPATPRPAMPTTSRTTTTTPSRTASATAVSMDSPLSEVNDLPLTPITNRRGKLSTKARGKRPTPADPEAGDATNVSRAKRSKRTSRK